MSKRKFRPVPWFVASIVLLGASIYVWQFHKDGANSEPDQFLHFALGRQMAEQGFIEKIPQATDLSWSEHYDNEYFLFTGLTALAWKVGGENAARALVPILVTLLALLVFKFCRRYLHWGWALGLSLYLLLHPYTVSRFLALRPSLLAESLFLGLVFGLVESNVWVVAATAFLFPLSYHAIYFPALALLFAALLGRIYSPKWLKTSAIGGAALIAGICLHPAFPHSLEMVTNVFTATLRPVQIPLSESSMEVQGWLKEQLFGRVPFFLAILTIALWQLSMEWAPTRPKKRATKVFWEPEFLFLFGLTAVFVALLLLSYRAVEYAGPLGLVFAALVIGRTARGGKERAAFFVMGFVFLLPEFPSVWIRPFPPSVPMSELRQAILALPPEANGKKVFNCDWYTGGPILYWNPNVQFSDLGDPGAIEKSHPGFTSLKMALRLAEVPYLLGPVRYAFKSDYVLCQHSPMVQSMEGSPHFRRLFPIPSKRFEEIPASSYFVYEVAKSLNDSFVTAFEVSNRSVASTWSKLESKSALPPEQRSPFVGLGSQTSADRTPTSSGNNCVELRPTSEAWNGAIGAKYLGLGGGPEVEVSLNGQKFFDRKKWSVRKDLDVLVPLPKALSQKDNLKIKVCSQKDRLRSGIAVSLWTPERLRSICDWKNDPLESSMKTYLDRPLRTCLGPVATLH